METWNFRRRVEWIKGRKVLQAEEWAHAGGRVWVSVGSDITHHCYWIFDKIFDMRDTGREDKKTGIVQEPVCRERDVKGWCCEQREATDVYEAETEHGPVTESPESLNSPDDWFGRWPVC